jgi:hypothetical protein
MKLGDEELKRFYSVGPEDYYDEVEHEMDLLARLNDSIRPICVWRALRVGCQVGEFMRAIAGTFAEPGDLWAKWRKGEIRNGFSAFVRQMDVRLFTLALAAQNLLLVRDWSGEEDSVLWAPADERSPR